MIHAIGFLELSSIAKGIETTDALIKAADINLIFSRPSCPGKYYILFSGQIGSVNASMDAGISIAKESIIDHVVIAQLDPQVLFAINQTSQPEAKGALGVMEFFSVTAAIYAADTAVKAANVRLLDVRTGTGIGGKAFVILTGDVGAVNAAVEAGKAHDVAKGLLIGTAVIANPSEQIFTNLY